MAFERKLKTLTTYANQSVGRVGIRYRCICFDRFDGKTLSSDCHVTDSTILIGQGEKRARFFYDMSKASPTRKMILIG